MKSKNKFAFAIFSLCLVFPLAAHAQNAPSDTYPLPATTVAPSPKNRSAEKIALVKVVLSEQYAYVYSKKGRLIASIAVSTGLDNSTPTGSFKVFSKSRETFYELNPTERMRWMVRFTKGRQGGNIGFHSIPFKVTSKGETKLFTPVGIAPSSHGCIRVRDVDAKWLFANIEIGTRVVVKKD